MFCITDTFVKFDLGLAKHLVSCIVGPEFLVVRRNIALETSHLIENGQVFRILLRYKGLMDFLFERHLFGIFNLAIYNGLPAEESLELAWLVIAVVRDFITMKLSKLILFEIGHKVALVLSQY